MSFLRTVWLREWTQLVELRPVVVELSSPAGQSKDGRQLYLPTKVTQHRAFPTILEGSLPKPDLSRLRRPSIERALDLSSDEERHVGVALQEAADWFAQTAEWLPRFERRISARELGVSSLREGLLGIIVPRAKHAVVLTDDQIDDLLEPYKLSGDKPYPEGLRRAMRAPGRAEAVHHRLLDRGMPPRPHDEPDIDARLEESERVLREFLDTAGLGRQWRTGRPDAAAEAAWEAAKSADSALWHWRARQLELCETAVPRLPDVVGEGVGPTSAPERWLDASFTDRLAPALRFDVEERPMLPPMETFIDEEVIRATSPLGLASESSRTMIALGGIVKREYVDGIELEEMTSAGVLGGQAKRSAVTEEVMAKVERWRRKLREQEGTATFPHQAVHHVTHLQAWYLSALWRRVHTREVGLAPIDTPGEAWHVLTEISLTAARNIRARKWTHEQVSRDDSGQREPTEPTFSAAEENYFRDRQEDLQRAAHDVISGLEAVDVSREEFAAFLMGGDWNSAQHRAQWSSWAENAGWGMSYENVHEWWDGHRPK